MFGAAEEQKSVWEKKRPSKMFAVKFNSEKMMKSEHVIW